MPAVAPKQILLEIENEEQLRIVEAFIQDQRLKAFRLEDSKAGTSDVLNDLMRFVIPII